MNTNFYTAASGLIVEERRLDLLANNLANASTPGYRAQRSFRQVWQRFDDAAGAESRSVNQAVALAGAFEMHGPGPARATGRLLDVALDDGDLLAVLTADGVRYTRNGALAVSTNGELTDAAGRTLLGPSGQPIDGLTGEARITGDGRVVAGTGEDATEVGRLRVVRFDADRMRPTGDNLYAVEGDDATLEEVAEPRMRTGWLEGSAADPVIEMVHLIEAQRAFESYQKLISMTMNDVNQAAIREITG